MLICGLLSAIIFARYVLCGSSTIVRVEKNMKIRDNIVFFLLVFFTGLNNSFAMDTSKYIPLSEIEPGMEGYALSVYHGTEIEKFPVRVVSVMRNHTPGHDAFLVIGTGKKFMHTGPVAGCSGSPVVLGGRIAGALAFGWSFPKDPLYGVTPIEEMLAIKDRKDEIKLLSVGVDLPQFKSGKLDFESYCNNINEMASERFSNGQNLICSSVSPLAFNSLGGFSTENIYYNGADFSGASTEGCLPNFEPGSVICIPLVDGDIKISVLGTVTAINGDDVFAFGHPFNGEGNVCLPFSTGEIYTVVASQSKSFKLGVSTVPIGAIVADQSTAVYGVVGEQAPQIPMKLEISAYDEVGMAKYDCLLAEHKMFTPMMIQSVISAAAFKNSQLPEFHTVCYRAVIDVDGVGDIVIDDISSARGMRDPAYEVAGVVGMIKSNQYHRPKINSIDFSARLEAEDINANITLTNVDDVKVEPGEKITINFMLEKEFGKKIDSSIEFTIPEDIKPGKKKIMLCGGERYMRFVNQMKPERTMYDDFDSMIKALKNELNLTKRVGIYAVLQTERTGFTVGKYAIDNLPDSKAVVLASPKRNYLVKPVYSWLEQKIEIPYIVKNTVEIQIEVVGEDD